MKNLLFSTLILSFFITSSYGQCDGNRMALKKQGERDWVKDYDNIERKFTSKTVSITSIRKFFYQNNLAKTCISYDSLKLLQKELEIVFPKSDKLVSELNTAIKGIIKANPKGFAGEPKSDSFTSNDSVEQVIDDTTSQFVADNSEIDYSSNEKTLKLEEDKSLWFWISIVLLLGFISLTTIYFLERKKYKEQIALKDDNFNKSQKENFDSEQNAIQVWKEKYLKVQKEKESLEKEFSDFKNSLSTINKEKEVVINQNIAKTATQEITPKQFYLSIPTPTDDGLGIFRDLRQVQANPASSFYRFELEHDETKAKFWFLDNPNTIQSAVIYPETYINPVCDYEGFNSNAKKIVTKQPGIAIKEGDIWKVRIKAKIRFE